MGYRDVMNAVSNVVHQLSPKSITQRKNQVKVKPGPDPHRIGQTTYQIWILASVTKKIVSWWRY